MARSKRVTAGSGLIWALDGGEGFDNLALRHGPLPAAANHSIEFGAHSRQVRDLTFDLGEMLSSYPVDRLARLGCVVGERQQSANGIKRKAKTAALSNEREPACVVRRRISYDRPRSVLRRASIQSLHNSEWC